MIIPFMIFHVDWKNVRICRPPLICVASFFRLKLWGCWGQIPNPNPCIYTLGFHGFGFGYGILGRISRIRISVPSLKMILNVCIANNINYSQFWVRRAIINILGKIINNLEFLQKIPWFQNYFCWNFLCNFFHLRWFRE